MIDEQEWLGVWNTRSAGPISEIADPEIEVHAVTLGIEGRHYRGHDGLRQWMRDIRDRFGARADHTQIVQLGDDAVMICGTLYIANDYGGDDEQRFAMVVHLRDDRARWIGTFFSPADARRAYEAGVTGPGSG